MFKNGIIISFWNQTLHLLTLKLLQACIHFFVLLNTKIFLEKKAIFYKYLKLNHLSAIDFHSIFISYFRSQWCFCFLLTHITNIFLCVQQNKTKNVYRFVTTYTMTELKFFIRLSK